MPTTFAVLGSGAWGTTVALLLASRPDHRVRLWSARPDTGRALARDRENVRLLPGVRIPDAVALTADIREAVRDADFWVSAVPTVHLRATMQRVRAEGGVPRAVVSLTKGIEVGTFARPSQIL
ncbi:MAG: NAD(P)-binding domain-containing protein, partial [Gemmataceae bacterium]